MGQRASGNQTEKTDKVEGADEQHDISSCLQQRDTSLVFIPSWLHRLPLIP